MPPPPPELELDDEPPPPPDDELDDDPLEDELDADDDELEAALELDEAALELAAVLEPDPWPAAEDDVPAALEEPSPEGSVGPVPHAVAIMPTPASAAPPDSMRRNCRRSSRRASASVNLLDSFIPLSFTREESESKSCAGPRQSGGSAPPS